LRRPWDGEGQRGRARCQVRCAASAVELKFKFIADAGGLPLKILVRCDMLSARDSMTFPCTPSRSACRHWHQPCLQLSPRGRLGIPSSVTTLSLADGRVEAMMEIVVVLQDATAKLASEHRLSWIVAKLSECGRCDHDNQSSSRRLDSQALSALTHRELA
jgi:hypothetical protein